MQAKPIGYVIQNVQNKNFVLGVFSTYCAAKKKANFVSSQDKFLSFKVIKIYPLCKSSCEKFNFDGYLG